MTNTKTTDWHRLFGITLIDYFTDTKYHVELEKELSHKKQRLDVIIIEQTKGPPLVEVPDGLENLAKHNLLTYKSHHQPLDAWAIDELLGHYVNYRKQESPSLHKLLPPKKFRLYAVSTRYPYKLAREVTLQKLQTGVYVTVWGPHEVRVIVLSRVPKVARNTLWHLFSGVWDKVEYARTHHQWRETDPREILTQLSEQYINEEVFMSYTMEDFRRDSKRYFLEKFKENPDDFLEGVSPDDLIKRLSPEDRLKGLSPEDIIKRLSPEDIIKRLSPEDRLKGLSPEVIKAYLAKQKKRKKA
jgi:hypothetical protein